MTGWTVSGRVGSTKQGRLTKEHVMVFFVHPKLCSLKEVRDNLQLALHYIANGEASVSILQNLILPKKPVKRAITYGHLSTTN